MLEKGNSTFMPRKMTAHDIDYLSRLLFPIFSSLFKTYSFLFIFSTVALYQISKTFLHFLQWSRDVAYNVPRSGGVGEQ